MRVSGYWGFQSLPGPGYQQQVAAFYDSMAEDYDALYRDRNSQAEDLVVRERILWMLGQHMGIRGRAPFILDVGCGTGLVLELLPWIPRQYYLGLDISGNMVARMRTKFPFHQVEIRDMDYGPWCVDRQADIVLSLFGTPSHSRRPQCFLSSVERALAPGGTALLMYLTRYGLEQSPIARYTHTLPVTARGIRNDPVVRAGLLRVRRMRGLTYETGRTVHLVTDRLFWRRWESRTVGRLFPDWGRYLVVELEKP